MRRMASHYEVDAVDARGYTQGSMLTARSVAMSGYSRKLRPCINIRPNHLSALAVPEIAFGAQNLTSARLMRACSMVSPVRSLDPSRMHGDRFRSRGGDRRAANAPLSTPPLPA